MTVAARWAAFNHPAKLGDRTLDAWGAGNPRATSGDETRITRAAHGHDRLYTRWSRRALQHWLHFQEEWGIQLFEPSGVLWFGGDSCADDDCSDGKDCPPQCPTCTCASCGPTRSSPTSPMP